MARAVFDVWNEGGLERLDPRIDPDVVHHDPYDPRGADGLARMKETNSPVSSHHPAGHDRRGVAKHDAPETRRLR
jgi:hypothetical protein